MAKALPNIFKSAIGLNNDVIPPSNPFLTESIIPPRKPPPPALESFMSPSFLITVGDPDDCGLSLAASN